MQTIQEIYTTSIQPLSDAEKLKLATFILENVSNNKTKQKGGDITQFFGMFDSGDPDSADNDKIDNDLAKAYSEDYDRSKL